jgi:gas vesicle protein
MNQNRFLSFGLGLLSGSLVGTALVILLTPKSGSELRETIVGKYNEILASGREAIAERRQALQAEYKVQTTRIQIPLDAPQSPQS